ncbi:uncharacterized protein LOC111022300 [Momordica charantia]|uniref:Uncharacterized protein LOC111022300 n=1 Tax=Momordica charantia TaxID=3673 RepID=A0A6J1DM82_MOMCH|nr:uncharacterized protein LOC111022300 [Momordica charantia]
MDLRLILNRDDWFPPTLTNLAHADKTTSRLKGRLTPTQIDMFRQTCFGPILDMDVVFNGPLIHHLLLREVEEPRQDIISFDLFGKRVSFGKREFDLITGLSYRMIRVDNDIPGRRLRARYFKDSVRVKCSELEKIFMETVFYDDEDAVKVGIVYFVELAMMGKERKQFIDATLLGVVDRWELFCNHDWSSLIFERTLWSLKNAVNDKLPAYQ